MKIPGTGVVKKTRELGLGAINDRRALMDDIRLEKELIGLMGRMEIEKHRRDKQRLKEPDSQASGDAEDQQQC
jgi:hypothetical protein